MSASGSSRDMGVGRREFLKSAAAVAIAAPALPYALGATARAAVAGSDRIRVGIIGCGGRGTGAVVQALRADPGAVLVSMGDIFEDRLESCLKYVLKEMGDRAAEKVTVSPETKFVGFDSYKKVIDSGVDVVVLTGYPVFRPEHLRAAVAAGKHVFVEKPLAVDGPGTRSVLETVEEARKKKLSLVVGLCWRYHDGMRATFERINSGAVGDVTTVHTTYLTSTLSKHPRKEGWSDTEFQLRNWWHFNWISGDHIVEQAVHSIDRLSWALGDRLPERVICLGGRAARSGPEHGNVFDHFGAVYEYAGGMRCFHTCRQIDGCPTDNADYIYGTKGSATVEGWAPIFSIRNSAGKERWKYTGRNDRDMYQNEHDALFASIRSRRPINDGVRGANSTMMAIMARMAAYTGQTVTWEKAMGSTEALLPERVELGAMEAAPVPVPGKTKFV
jgi:myo-inositol 2-dehydrogenase/D-chiro-inositol 1-dehydrogenase